MNDEYEYCCFFDLCEVPSKEDTVSCFIEVFPLDSHESFCRILKRFNAGEAPFPAVCEDIYGI